MRINVAVFGQLFWLCGLPLPPMRGGQGWPSSGSKENCITPKTCEPSLNFLAETLAENVCASDAYLGPTKAGAAQADGAFAHEAGHFGQTISAYQHGRLVDPVPATEPGRDGQLSEAVNSLMQKMEALEAQNAKLLELLAARL